MVVWGGGLDTGGRYDPIADTWTPTSTANAPSARSAHTAVWTGSLMIVWGGLYPYLNTGARYDPATDTWTPMSTTNAPSARYDHTAVWTGSLMVVWGGYDGSSLNTGARYDPATDTWTPTSTANSPSARHSHTAVWTGNLMIVWGGYDGSFFLNTGGRYVIAPVVDGDGDGFSECQGDCDDTNPVVHPGVAESCDGIDNNCDGRIDEGFD